MLSTFVNVQKMTLVNMVFHFISIFGCSLFLGYYFFSFLKLFFYFYCWFTSLANSCGWFSPKKFLELFLAFVSKFVSFYLKKNIPLKMATQYTHLHSSRDAKKGLFVSENCSRYLGCQFQFFGVLAILIFFC